MLRDQLKNHFVPRIFSCCVVISYQQLLFFLIRDDPDILKQHIRVANDLLDDGFQMAFHSVYECLLINRCIIAQLHIHFVPRCDSYYYVKIIGGLLFSVFNGELKT
ncbi:hypothetical protein BBR01nite_01100 [Brevibacillus brevis]|nr:hypothetical protein BBR01nite_01100 [Brevibacillus brevis]